MTKRKRSERRDCSDDDIAPTVETRATAQEKELMGSEGARADADGKETHHSDKNHPRMMLGSSGRGWPNTFVPEARLRLASTSVERKRARMVWAWWLKRPLLWNEVSDYFERVYTREFVACHYRARGMGAVPEARGGLYTRFELFVEKLMTRKRPFDRTARAVRVDALRIMFAERCMTDKAAGMIDDAGAVKNRITSIPDSRAKWGGLVEEAIEELVDDPIEMTEATPDDFVTGQEVAVACGSCSWDSFKKSAQCNQLPQHIYMAVARDGKPKRRRAGWNLAELDGKLSDGVFAKLTSNVSKRQPGARGG